MSEEKHPVNTLYQYSTTAKTIVDVTFSIAPNMTWDGYWRLIYDKMNQGLQQQANILMKHGNLSAAEAQKLVLARNQLILKIRDRLSPFGELYSEILKPREGLKSFEQLVNQKGTIEAVLKSVGKTRVVVDHIGVISRVAGPATIVLEITMSAFVVQQAPVNNRASVAAQQTGGVIGAIGGGIGGMWAGCATGAMLASPSLVIPVVGEISEGGACIIGGILGGLGVGGIGREVGEAAGEGIYDKYTDISDFSWSKN